MKCLDVCTNSLNQLNKKHMENSDENIYIYLKGYRIKNEARARMCVVAWVLNINSSRFTLWTMILKNI